MSNDPATPGRYARVIRQDVRSMHAYAIQDSAGLVKLDAMENPFRLPEALQRELGRRLGAVAINRYPTRCVADVIAAARYVISRREQLMRETAPTNESRCSVAVEPARAISRPAG